MALNDGLATAPTNTPQLPTLLDGYAARPTWSVAGVDYAVGYSSGTTLSNPSTISMAGVSVDQANHIINVSGSNVTLSGYDFSLDGGWGVSVNGGSNITIENSKFVVGSNGNTPIYVSQNASNVTVQNNLIDGAGSSSQMLIAADGAGTTTIQYNMIQNAWGQNLVMSSDVGGETWIVQYNVIKDAGLGYEQGAHGDWIQTYNLPGKNTADFEVNFNTFVQTAPISDGRTQGISAFSANSGSDAGGVQHESFNNNTFIAKNDAYVNYGIILDTSRLIGTATIQNNYFDTTNIGSANGGGGGWEYVGNYNGSSGGPYNGTVTQSNNVNMTAGAYFDQSGTPPTGTSTPTTSAPAAPTPTTAPAAPTIASYSTDSGVAGDGVTNDNTVELKGSAAAGSTVKIYDGSTQIGSTTATSTGSWDYITKVLTDAKHTLTATATNSSGQTSAASAAVAVTVDTKAPAAPTIASDTVNSANQVVVTGTAEANSAIKVYDGTTQVGTATTNSSGAWSVTTSALSAGSHALTAKATDVAGNVSAASTVVDPVIGSGSSGSTGSGTSGSGTSGTGTSGSGTSGTGTSGSGTSGTGTSGTGTSGTGTSGSGTSGTSTAPAAPKIGSFSTDSGVAGDHITNDKTLTLAGTAAANSTVKVFDGTTQLGTATADANGAWHYTTVALPDGKHSLTATDTVSGVTSKASTVLDVTVDAAAPDAPVLLSDVTSHHRATVTGTAEAGSTIKVYEGTTLLGTGTTGADGHFSVTTSGLKTGSHTFVASATDAAGNTSALSQPIDPPIGSHGGNGTSTVEVTNVRPHWDHTATIKGTADPNSQIKLFDGTTSVGSVTAGDNGKWSFHTSDLSGKTHAFTAEQVDTTGHVVGTSSGEAIIGTGRSNTLTGTTGNDIMVGKRGADSFEFASNFGHDVIKDFAARGPAHDTIEFSKGVFDSFASVLSHAAQSGHDVVIATGSDTLTLKNTQLDKLNSHDFHFA